MELVLLLVYSSLFLRLSILKNLLPDMARLNAAASKPISLTSPNFNKINIIINCKEANEAKNLVNNPKIKHKPVKTSIIPMIITIVLIFIGIELKIGIALIVSAQMSPVNFPIPNIKKTIPKPILKINEGKRLDFILFNY